MKPRAACAELQYLPCAVLCACWRCHLLIGSILRVKFVGGKTWEARGDNQLKKAHKTSTVHSTYLRYLVPGISHRAMAEIGYTRLIYGRYRVPLEHTVPQLLRTTSHWSKPHRIRTQPHVHRVYPIMAEQVLDMKRILHQVPCQCPGSAVLASEAANAAKKKSIPSSSSVITVQKSCDLHNVHAKIPNKYKALGCVGSL